MSLGVVIKGSDGIVLAVDSRVTLNAQRKGMPSITINFDNASKFLHFSPPHDFIGAVTYGTAIIGQRTAHSFIPEFEQSILSKSKERLKIISYARKLSDFYMNRWQELTPKDYKGLPINFIIGGYDKDEPYGSVYLFNIPNMPKPEPKNPNDFGMTWGGQLEIASRIIQGCDPRFIDVVKNTLKLNDDQVNLLITALRKNLGFPIPYAILPLQDCVDLAIFLIRSTITAQRLSIGIRGVGGLIEVATVKRTQKLTFIQKKEIKGES